MTMFAFPYEGSSNDFLKCTTNMQIQCFTESSSEMSTLTSVICTRYTI